MMHPSWHDTPPTGWDPFDREHADLVRTLGALLSAVEADDLGRARISSAQLVGAAGEHFAHEERVMREVGYPRLAQHEEAHALYLADAAGLARHVVEKGLTPEFRRWSTGRVLEWFRFHVATNDVALGAFLAERGRALQAGGERSPAPKP